eukprot:gnl/TRDRNA2_/TRDRNA2_130672_c1_seq1.p1 gnl/TRDRNA2_/TRDRNA2_130672_c1~~gnl/TRDRNA2_/TRDRNA2_130672_c1_seq1.p1  ORF type:complete len:463 (-),score=82.77 gnl/TRDRNA2_/TRDRNA2_130672_c1_seq1:81-1427(-)
MARVAENTSFQVVEEALIPPEPDPRDARLYRREFLLMSATFGLNHATVTTPIIFASTVLTNSAGQGGNAMLYGATLVFSLFFANPVFSILGPKRSLSISMFLYAVYVCVFAVSSAFCAEWSVKGACLEGEPLQLPIVLAGAFVGGCGAGLLWTAQGAFFASVCERVAVAEVREKPEVTAELAGTFAFIFLGFECTIRASTTVLHKYVELSIPLTFYLYAGLALAAMVTFTTFATNLQSAAPPQKGSFCSKVFAAIDLWRDPKLWVLQCTNITFGFAAAWLGGYVGRDILTKALSSGFIGFAGALLSGLAALLSKVFSKVAAKSGKGPIVLLGAISFLALGCLSRWGDHPEEWGWGALIFYVLMGIGRAVYESTNKAIFADFFPGEKSPGAFANVFVFGTGASTVAFVLGAVNDDLAELYLLLIFAALTFPGFLLASVMNAPAAAQTAQ